MKKRVMFLWMAAMLLVTSCGTQASQPVDSSVAVAQTSEADGEAQAADEAEATEETKGAEQVEMAEGEQVEGEQAEEQDAWTVMLYLCGTDLESEGGAATFNLKEIMQTVPNDSVNFVMQTGGTKQWQAEEAIGLAIDPDKLQRYRFDAEGFVLEEDLPLANMASAETLSDFIAWGAQAHPAEKYLLVLWDHGGGSLSGLILDEIHNNAIMSLEELGRALGDAGVALEAVALDTCLMASLETAQAIAPYAKYLIASEETVPGPGTSYDKWLQYIYDTPSCDGEKLGRVICDSVQQKYAEMGYEAGSSILTFSTIDLSKIDAVAEAFGNMALEMSAMLEDPNEFQYFAFSTNRTEEYGSGTHGMVDLADMAGKAKNIAITAETADAVIDAVHDAVTYSIKGSGRSYGHGLSFCYIPTEGAYYLDHYARNCQIPEYLAFLDAVSGKWTAPAWVYEQTERVPEINSDDYLVDMEVSVEEDGHLQLQVTRGVNAVSAVDYVLYQYDMETEELYRLGQNFDVDGDFESGVFTDRFDGMWPALDGMFCDIELIDETNSHNIYSIPVILKDDKDWDDSWELRAGYVYDVPLDEEAADDAGSEAVEENTEGVDSEENGHVPDALAGQYKLYGAWQGYDVNTNMPNRNVIDIKDLEGVTCTPLLGDKEGESFVINEHTKMEEKELPDGVYVYAFLVTDVFGRTYEAEEALLVWEDGEATFMLME